MNGFMDKLSEKIMPLANLLGQNRYLTVLRDAFMLSFPFNDVRFDRCRYQ